MAFQEIEHTADWALRVEARDIKELFTEAARGMYALAGVRARPDGVPEEVVEVVEVEGVDRESLLVAFLQELLYALEARGLLAEAIAIGELSGSRLRARVRFLPGERPEKTIKAVTYNDLHIEETPGGCRATLVFDV